MPKPGEVNKTEAWLRNHEEWLPQKDSLRDRVIRVAASAHVRAQNEKGGSRKILVICVIFFAAVTWVLRDAHDALKHLREPLVSRWGATEWVHPVESHMIAVSGIPHRTYEWNVVQANLSWRERCLRWLASFIQ